MFHRQLRVLIWTDVPDLGSARGGRALFRAGSIRHEEPDEILLVCGKVILTVTVKVTVMSSRLGILGMCL